MNGKIEIRISTPRIVYDLSFEGNISVVRGDSGTGKSFLCTLIEQACTKSWHSMPSNFMREDNLLPIRELLPFCTNSNTNYFGG